MIEATVAAVEHDLQGDVRTVLEVAQAERLNVNGQAVYALARLLREGYGVSVLAANLEVIERRRV